MEAGQFDQVRLIAFGGIFALMAILEVLFPRRDLSKPKLRRWSSNVLLTILSTLSARYLLPFTAVSAALFAESRQIGFFNNVEVNPILAAVFIIVLFDMIIYWQHRIFHRIPVLWKFHRVHHVDPDLDVTTGARFHPVEIVLSMVIKLFVILALGAPAITVVIFETILNLLAMFNHSNVKLPLKLDDLVRKVIVTPDFHRVHHSVYPNEHHSNFGFNLSIWDRIFRSYVSQPKDGHDNMKIGISSVQEDLKTISIFGMLVLPFIKEKS